MKRVAVTLAALAFVGLAGAAMLELAAPPVRLAAQVAANMDNSGVAHPVTAVLLNFRGYDTLLEIAVLLIALVGLAAVAGRDEAAQGDGTVEPVLQTLARLAAPLRWGLAAGFLVFLAVAAATIGEGALLQYPPAWAGGLILAIEAGLAVSLGLTLAGLFLFLSEEERQ